MHPIEKRLYNDHAHFDLLLRCLEHRTFANRTQSQWCEDLPVILDALDYIKVYPERWHHPVEDKIFNHIAEHHPQHAPLIQSLFVEHQQLEQLTATLNGLFMNLAAEKQVSLDELSNTMCEFLQRQSDHMEYENENIYPLMQRYLKSQDWDHLMGSIAVGLDPMFDTLLSEYEGLFKQIMKTENTQYLDR